MVDRDRRAFLQELTILAGGSSLAFFTGALGMKNVDRLKLEPANVHDFRNAMMFISSDFATVGLSEIHIKHDYAHVPFLSAYPNNEQTYDVYLPKDLRPHAHLMPSMWDKKEIYKAENLQDLTNNFAIPYYSSIPIEDYSIETRISWSIFDKFKQEKVFWSNRVLNYLEQFRNKLMAGSEIMSANAVEYLTYALPRITRNSMHSLETGSNIVFAFYNTNDFNKPLGFMRPFSNGKAVILADNTVSNFSGNQGTVHNIYENVPPWMMELDNMAHTEKVEIITGIEKRLWSFTL